MVDQCGLSTRRGVALNRFRLRVWLEDRPGALGAVASRIGSVRGDLVGVEILERGGGRVVDDLIVEIDSEDLVDLMVREVMEVDGVDVEYVRQAGQLDGDGSLLSLQTAAQMVSIPDPKEKAIYLSNFLYENMGLLWVCVVDVQGPSLWFSRGDIPKVEWVAAFVSGAAYDKDSPLDGSKPSDLAWAYTQANRVAIMIGRADHPFRDSERKQISYLATIVSCQSCSGDQQG